MRNTKRVAAMAFIATFGLIAAACGDDSSSSDTTKAPAGSTADSTADSTANSVAPGDLKVGVAFDTGGRGDGGVGDRLAHLVMPAAVLSLATVASWSRFVRAGMMDVLNQDYIRTAYAKGRSESGVVLVTRDMIAKL